MPQSCNLRGADKVLKVFTTPVQRRQHFPSAVYCTTRCAEQQKVHIELKDKAQLSQLWHKKFNNALAGGNWWHNMH